MRAPGIVESEVFAQLGTRVTDGILGVEIEHLLLHALPQALDEDVVVPAAFAIHADLNSLGQQAPGERRMGKLRTLAGNEVRRSQLKTSGRAWDHCR